jgi:hypothetical protein
MDLNTPEYRALRAWRSEPDRAIIAKHDGSVTLVRFHEGQRQHATFESALDAVAALDSLGPHWRAYTAPQPPQHARREGNSKGGRTTAARRKTAI